jgi:hypothetical protein
MTRRITYANQLASSLFALQNQKEDMLARGFLAQAILGTTTELDGFACTPNSPADLTVLIGQGTIFKYINVDATPFGELPSQIPADTTNNILKFAYNVGTVQTAAFTAPATVGFSRNDLIQFNLQEVDGDSTNLPFWGGTTNVTINGVSVPIPNPVVSDTKNVRRLCNVVIDIKQGTPAATGTQVTPTPDAGYVGAWVVTIAQGQTTITGGDISLYPNAPFITDKLKDKISQAFADARYAFKDAVPTNKAYFSGFEITNNVSDTDHDIDFGAGECADSTGSAFLSLASTMTKRIDATWAAGNNQGGLFSGTVASNTTYHLFVIQKDSDGSIDAGFDTSITAANIPTGYTNYRRVASLYTDSSANLVQITNMGDEFLLKVPVNNYNTTNPGTSAILVTLSVPLGFKSRVIAAINTECLATGGGLYNLLVTSTDQTDTVPSDTVFTIRNDIGASVQLNNTVYSNWRTNTSGQIRVRLDVSDADLTVFVITHGWLDDRGRFG